MKNVLILILFLNSLFLNSQSFFRSYSAQQPPNFYSMGMCAPIIQTADGGYILNYASSYPDIHGTPYTSEAIKTDANFNPIWKKRLWGENGRKTILLNDGSIIFYGTPFYDYSMSFHLEKVDNNGNSVWDKYDYDISPDKTVIQDVFLQNGTNLKVLGTKIFNNSFFTSTSKPVIMDFDLDGNYLGGVLISIPNLDGCGIINSCKDSSENYFLNLYRYPNFYIVKFNANNTPIWQKKASYSADAMTILNDGNLLIGGGYSGSPARFFLAKISSSDGNLIWSKAIDYTGSYIREIKQLSTGEIILSGLAYDGNYIPRAMLSKIDSDANVIWTKKYSNAFSISEAFEKNTNEIYFNSYFYSYDVDQYPNVFKIDANGVSGCNDEDITVNFTNISLSLDAISLTTSPFTLLSPQTATGTASESVTYTDDCLPLSTSNNSKKESINIFPNPSSGLININCEKEILEITIYSSLGQKIQEIKPKSLQTDFYIENKGVFLLKIVTIDGVFSEKVIVK